MGDINLGRNSNYVLIPRFLLTYKRFGKLSHIGLASLANQGLIPPFGFAPLTSVGINCQNLELARFFRGRISPTVSIASKTLDAVSNLQIYPENPFN